MLTAISDSLSFITLSNRYITVKLKIPPVREYASDNIDENKSDEIVARIHKIISAVGKPNVYNAKRVIILESPIFAPGIGITGNRVSI